MFPLIAENLFTTLFGLLNTGMISSSGVTSLSAVSLVDTLNTFLFVFYAGIATGACVVVANYRGQGDADKLHEASVQAVTLFFMWAVRVLGGFILGVWLDMGVLGIWIAMDLDWLVRAVIFPIRFRGTKWLEHKAITAD